MSGLVYGERKLTLTKKSQYLDIENNIFCEITWGKSKTKNEISKFNDYFEGKIVKLKPKTKTTDMTKIK
jgi:hypothetical protein